MANFFKIDIPEPCTENWDKMIPNENGRHCDSCAKTVVDFTGMHPLEIQSYLQTHLHKGVCGRIKQEDLSTIRIYVPQAVIESQVTFQKIFLLALLIAMGTFLFSCTTNTGEKKQISDIEIVDNEGQQHVDENGEEYTDLLLGMVAPPPEIIEGEMVITDDMPNMHMYNVDTTPRYKGTPANATEAESLAFLEKSIMAFVQSEMKKRTLDTIKVKSRERVLVKFDIDSTGNVANIITRAEHESLKEMAIEVISTLPRFTPATYQGKPVIMSYMIPIQYNN